MLSQKSISIGAASRYSCPALRNRKSPIVLARASAPPETASSPPGIAQRRTAARDPADLNDPAQIGAKGRAKTPVTEVPGSESLSSYMLLPVEQYFVLDKSQIQHLGGNRFLLLVPRIAILSVWIEPEVEVCVTTDPITQKVMLKAEHCRIRGSELVESMRLDQRFCMSFVTELTWDRGQLPTSSHDSTSSSFSSREGSPTSSSFASSSASVSSSEQGRRGGVGSGGGSSISGDAKLDVWCEVIPPFNLMPRQALVASCNVVMSGLVNTLLPMFLRKLAEDYQRWAVDPEYRAQRASRSQPLS